MVRIEKAEMKRHHSTLARSLRLCAVAMILFSASAFATDGTQLIGIGALQKGTGGAGVASPKDMTWVMLNPASIIDLGHRIDINLEYFAPYRTNSPKGVFGNNGHGEMTDNSFFLIPSMGYSKSCGCGKEAWGIGLYGVNGMGVDYRKSRSILPPLLFQNYDRRTEYSSAKVVVGYARDVGNGWTVGVGGHLNYAMFKTDMLTLKFGQAKAKDDWDDAYGLGFSLGLYKRWERFGIGATYTSRQWMTEFKKYDDLFFESMDLPQMFQAGIVFDLTPSVEIVADYKWMNWSGIDQIGDEPILGGFGWRDQHILKLGATWYASPKWAFRTGLSHAKAPIDEEHVFANALFPALTETHASIGFSYAISEKSDIHMTYMHAFNNKLTDSGRGGPFSVLGKGTEISLMENTVTLEYSYKFQNGKSGKKRARRMKDRRNGKAGRG
jgi:long-chain fatty acid transport protein